MAQFTVEVRESIGKEPPYWVVSETRIRIRADDLRRSARELDALIAQRAVAKLYGRRMSLHVEHHAPGFVVGSVYRPSTWPGDTAMWERADVGRLSIGIYL